MLGAQLRRGAPISFVREQGQGIIVRQAAHRPQAFAAIQAEAAKGIGFRQGHQGAFGQCGAAREIGEAGIAIAALVHDGVGVFFAKAVDLAKAQSEAEFSLFIALQGAVPIAEGGVGRQHRHAMLAGAAHDLGGRIKAHRLGIEQRRREGRGMMFLDPGRNIDQQREAGGMAFGKTVTAEALDLFEAAFREFPGHSRDWSCRR